MNLTFRQDYWDSPKLKNEFHRFLATIFGFDLSLWDRMGYWDDKYRPFSYFDGDRLVAHLCVYSMDMVIFGKRRQVAQISAVGTLPEYRRQGLNSRLTEQAVAWARGEHDFFFLFADEDAQPFYKACGWRMIDEHKARIAASGKTARGEIVKLDPGNRDHLDLMYRYAINRTPVSDVLGVFNPKLFMFWCLYYLKGAIYHIPELDVLVLFSRKNGLVTIHDIVGPTIPDFAAVYPYISKGGDRTVEFEFMVDKLNLGKHELFKVMANGTHLLGDCPFEEKPFYFPLTAHA